MARQCRYIRHYLYFVAESEGENLFENAGTGGNSCFVGIIALAYLEYKKLPCLFNRGVGYLLCNKFKYWNWSLVLPDHFSEARLQQVGPLREALLREDLSRGALFPQAWDRGLHKA